MRWEQTVGAVRWGRIHSDLKENLPGDVGLVCGMQRGIDYRELVTGWLIRGSNANQRNSRRADSVRASSSNMADAACTIMSLACTSPSSSMN
jgi:hypothetical protein